MHDQANYFEIKRVHRGDMTIQDRKKRFVQSVVAKNKSIEHVNNQLYTNLNRNIEHVNNQLF